MRRSRGEDYRRLRREIGKVIIGQDDVVEELLTGLFARGHVLLVGPPGCAKDLCWMVDPAKTWTKMRQYSKDAR